MPTNLIASGTTVAQSDDFTLAAGEEAHIHFFSASAPGTSPVNVDILLKNSAGTYTLYDTLSETRIGAVITAPGTYAVKRGQCTVAVGVDRD